MILDLILNKLLLLIILKEIHIIHKYFKIIITIVLDNKSLILNLNE